MNDPWFYTVILGSFKSTENLGLSLYGISKHKVDFLIYCQIAFWIKLFENVVKVWIPGMSNIGCMALYTLDICILVILETNPCVLFLVTLYSLHFVVIMLNLKIWHSWSENIKNI